MALNVYEALFIFDSNKYARDAAGVSGAVAEVVSKIDGTIRADRLWVEQKLAYPVEGNRKGTYWLTYFEADSERIVEFNRLCKLNNAILRHMVIKIDPRLVDALVAHARGEAQPEAPAEPEAEKKSDTTEAKTEEKTEAVAEAAEA